MSLKEGENGRVILSYYDPTTGQVRVRTFYSSGTYVFEDLPISMGDKLVYQTLSLHPRGETLRATDDGLKEVIRREYESKIKEARKLGFV